MKFKSGGNWIDVFWGDHACEACRDVDIAKPNTFVRACAMGSELLAEELVKRERPRVRRNREDTKAWAERAGAFKTRSAKMVQTKYKE
jgi:hypothetical protein